MYFFSRLFILTLIFNFQVFAKVEAPNYNFSLDLFKTFMPGQKLEQIKKKYKKISIEKKENGLLTYKAKVDKKRYKFSIFFQIKEETQEVTDFFTRLPSYFLHDTFHQSIINRFGKQNKYFKKEEAAVYIWNKKEVTHTYSGACSITCFPIYYTVYSNEDDYTPIFKAMN